MTKLEYQNGNYKVELDAVNPIYLTSRYFKAFIEQLSKFNNMVSLESITMTKDADQYDYSVLTKTGNIFDYIFYWDNQEFELSLTTDSTRWKPENAAQNVFLRRAVFDMILQFELNSIEVIYT